jgi:acyl carrier protein
MERSKIFIELTELFIDNLDEEGLVLKDTTTAMEIDGWDSLTHIILVVAIEKHFKIRFTSREIHSWKNVGEMINSIEKNVE